MNWSVKRRYDTISGGAGNSEIVILGIILRSPALAYRAPTNRFRTLFFADTPAHYSTSVRRFPFLEVSRVRTDGGVQGQ